MSGGEGGGRRRLWRAASRALALICMGLFHKGVIVSSHALALPYLGLHADTVVREVCVWEWGDYGEQSFAWGHCTKGEEAMTTASLEPRGWLALLCIGLSRLVPLKAS